MHWCFAYNLFYLAVTVVSEPSTKRCREEDGNGENKEGETEEKTQNINWPEPLPRPAPPIHTVVKVTAELKLSLPEGCKDLCDIPQTCIEEAEKIRLAIYSHF